MKHSIPVDYLRECFVLDEATGDLYWRERPRSHFATDRGFACFSSQQAGKRADLDTYPLNGYRRVRITVAGKKFALSAHRVVYAIFHGRHPEREIDHIDRCRVNNAPANLRDVCRLENMRNSSGYRKAKPVSHWRELARVVAA
jgi:hypothetical protein